MRFVRRSTLPLLTKALFMPFIAETAEGAVCMPAPMSLDLATLTILVVDDQLSVRALIAAQLRQSGVGLVIEAGDSEQAVDLFCHHHPDLVLLDVTMPGHDGYWAAREMRRHEAGRWTPIIFLSSRDGGRDVWQGVEAGGDDYLVKPVMPIVLHAKIRAMQRLLGRHRRLAAVSAELQEVNQRLNRMVEVDALTGLVNRRGMDRILHSEIAAARREQKPLTLVLCDVDYFKLYNDAWGHVRGDGCLREIGQLLRRICMRPRDVAARYGGEEFALILPGTSRSGAMTLVRTLGETLKREPLPRPPCPTGEFVTMSGGITTCIPQDDTSAESMLARADEALYAAKSQGRNRFFSFDTPTEVTASMSCAQP